MRLNQWIHLSKGRVRWNWLLTWSVILWLVGVLPAAAQPAHSVDQLIQQGRQAGAPVEMLQQVARRGEKAGLSDQQMAQLIEPAVRLAEQQLPADLVLEKTLEGLAKRVPASRIHPVLQRMQTQTRQSGVMVASWIDRPEVRTMMGVEEAPPGAARGQLVKSVAQARMQGVPESVVQELLQGLPASTKRRPILPSEVAAALQVLPELPANEASAATVRLLTTALDAGYGSSDLHQLPAAMRIAQQQGQHPPGVLVRGAAQAIANGTPAADVLSQLFSGGVPGTPPGKGGGPPGEVGPSGNGPPGQGKPPNTPPRGKGNGQGSGNGNGQGGGNGNGGNE